LLDHEQITVGGAAARTDPRDRNPIETTVGERVDDQEEWAHVDH
jgi:hypothetical protein